MGRLIGGAALTACGLLGASCASDTPEADTIAFSDETTTTTAATTAAETETTAAEPTTTAVAEVDPVDTDVFIVGVGDCMGEVSDGLVETVGAVPCDQPHQYEVYYAFDLDDDAFPGDQAVTIAGEERCLAEFDSFVGLAYADSIYGFTTLTPTEVSWNDLGDREVLCLIGNYDETPKTGSARGTGV